MKFAKQEAEGAIPDGGEPKAWALSLKLQPGQPEEQGAKHRHAQGSTEGWEGYGSRGSGRAKSGSKL